MWVVRIWDDEILLTSAFCSPMVKASTSSVRGTVNGACWLRVAPIRPNSSSSTASTSKGNAYSLRDQLWRDQFTMTAVNAAPAVNASSAPVAASTSCMLPSTRLSDSMEAKPVMWDAYMLMSKKPPALMAPALNASMLPSCRLVAAVRCCPVR